MTKTIASIHRVVRSCGPRSTRVVLVHGSMDTAASFAAFEGLLPGVTVERYDRRGYGRSGAAGDPGVPFEQHVEDLVDVLDGRPAVLFGHSLGGAVTLAAAVRVPDLVSAALVYEVPMPWLAWWPRLTLPAPAADRHALTTAAEAFLRRHLGRRRWETLPGDVRAAILAGAPAWAAELASATEHAPFEPEAVRVPVVSAFGTATDERHASSAVWLAERIPDARLAQIPGADHRAHRGRAVDLVALLQPLLKAAASVAVNGEPGGN